MTLVIYSRCLIRHFANAQTFSLFLCLSRKPLLYVCTCSRYPDETIDYGESTRSSLDSSVTDHSRFWRHIPTHYCTVRTKDTLATSIFLETSTPAADDGAWMSVVSEQALSRRATIASLYALGCTGSSLQVDKQHRKLRKVYAFQHSPDSFWMWWWAMRCRPLNPRN